MRERRRWMGGRRLAVGIDVGREALRVAFVSRRGNVPTIEALELEPYAVPCDVSSSDWRGITQALAAIVARLEPKLPMRGLSAVMALSYREVITASLEPSAAAHGAVVPAVYAEAERATGMPRDSLAIDWCVNDILYPGRLMIASTDQARIELRIEAVASAGLVLTGIDGEPYAALRALRQIALGECPSHLPYAAIWLGEDGADVWRVEGDSVSAHRRAPSPAFATLPDLLRAFVEHDEPYCAIVGGQVGTADRAASVVLAEIADQLGCPALPFDCSAYCARGGVGEADRHAPGFTVAFGLGLRGVCQ